jgi:hypothetical protein
MNITVTIVVQLVVLSGTALSAECQREWLLLIIMHYASIRVCKLPHDFSQWLSGHAGLRYKLR